MAEYMSKLWTDPTFLAAISATPANGTMPGGGVKVLPGRGQRVGATPDLQTPMKAAGPAVHQGPVVHHQGPTLTKLTIFYDNSAFVVGKEPQFRAMGDFSDKTYDEVKTGITWSSTNDKAVFIEPKTGKATITGTGKATLKVVDDSTKVASAPFDVVTEGEYVFHMPDGDIKYYADQEWWVRPALTQALKSFKLLESMDLELDDAWTQLGNIVAAVKPVDEIVKQITQVTDANRDIKQDAQIADNTKDGMKTIKIILQNFQLQLDNAHASVESAIVEMDISEKAADAAELRARAEEQKQLIETAITLAKSAVEIAAAPELFVFDNLMPAIEAGGAVAKLFIDADLVGKAERLEKEIRDMQIKQAANHYAQAKKSVAGVLQSVHDAENADKEFTKKYGTRQKSAEKEFDTASKGDFKFDMLTKGIVLANRVLKLASKVSEQGEVTRNDANKLSNMGKDKRPPDGWSPADRPEAERILKIMYGDGIRRRNGQAGKREPATVWKKKLVETYEKAQAALAGNI